MSEQRVNQSNPIVKFHSVPHSRKAAINAMCAMCMGCTATSLEAGFRNMVKNCASTSCPLHAFRPYQTETDDEQVLEIQE
jgi:hypothetical protein